jgi:signal peptidase I
MTRMRATTPKSPAPRHVTLKVIGLIAILCSVFVACSEKDYRVPHNAMAPTITNGQRIKVAFKAYDSASPARNDLVLYETPWSADLWIGRVVGIPGDSVVHAMNALLLNGRPIRIPGRHVDYKAQPTNGETTLQATYNLKNGFYFILSDNTDRSTDSRHFGLIQASAVKGKIIK